MVALAHTTVFVNQKQFTLENLDETHKRMFNTSVELIKGGQAIT